MSVEMLIDFQFIGNVITGIPVITKWYHCYQLLW